MKSLHGVAETGVHKCRSAQEMLNLKEHISAVRTETLSAFDQVWQQTHAQQTRSTQAPPAACEPEAKGCVIQLNWERIDAVAPPQQWIYVAGTIPSCIVFEFRLQSSESGNCKSYYIHMHTM